jgi:hypothetical protein
MRKRQLMAKSEQSFAEKAILFGNSAKTYQESFASTAVLGLISTVIAAVGLFNGQEVLSVILFGIGAFFLFRSAGLYRSGKKFRELAENQIVGQNK